MRDDWSAAPDGNDPTTPTDDGLALQALLYASGELEEAEAVAFEERLADDQAAREALCQAVQLTETLAGNPDIRPDPAYRARVRRRLRQRKRFRQTLAGTLRLAGNPALWSFIAAALAILMLVVFVLCVALQHTPDPAAPPSAPDFRPATEKDDLSYVPRVPVGLGVSKADGRPARGARD